METESNKDEKEKTGSGHLKRGGIKPAEYEIPKWCTLSLNIHNDKTGGCWGISHGSTKRQGKYFCRSCGYYEVL